jgi:hypothetical protein
MFEVEGLRVHLLAFGCWNFGRLFGLEDRFWQAALG